MKKCINKFDISLSILFSLITIFGESYKKIDSWDLVFNNIFRSFLLFIIYFILYYFILNIIKNIFKKISFNNNKNKFTEFIFERHPFICPFIIISICYIPYLIIKYPGSPGWDFHHFLNNYYNYDNYLTQHFPLAYVFMCIYFIKFGILIRNVNIGLFLLTIFHSLFMIVSFSLVFVYLKKWKINSKFRYFVLLFYSLNPLFLNYSTTIYHDIIYSSLILIYILLITDIIKFKKSKIITISIISLFICLTRKNGIFIVIPTNLFLILKYYKKEIKKTVLLILPIIIFFISNMLFSTKYIKTSILEAMAIPIQTISRYSRDYHNDISKQDKSKVSRLIDYDLAAELYNPTIVDDVRNSAGNYFATKKEIIDFLKVWLKLFFKHPTVYVQAVINNTYQLYYPFENTTYIFFSSKEEDNYDTYINFKEPKYLKKYKNDLKNITYKFENISIINYIDDPGYYIWIFIFILTIITKEKKNIIPTVPLIMTFLCCIAGPTIDYNSRYAFPIIFSCFPLFAYYSKEIYK